MRCGYKQCDECGNNEHFDLEGWGKDEFEGEYIVFICEECGEQLIIYEDRE